MERLRWWQGDWLERQKFNEAADELNSLQRNQSSIDSRLVRLFELDKDQGRELARLQATTWTLIDLLVEKGLVTEPEVAARISAAIDELEAGEARETAEQSRDHSERDPFRIAPRRT
jgi:hypothetical protein